jgi:CheY-like chemotaxis protein
MLRQYALVNANDGRLALDRLHDHQDIDLVLLDTNMPNMDGAEFLTEMRSLPLHHQPRVIVLGRGSDAALLEGADASIALPFDSDTLLAKIKALPEPVGVDR